MTQKARLSILFLIAAVVPIAVAALALADSPARLSHRHVRPPTAAHAAASQGLARLAPEVAALRVARGPSDAVTDELVGSTLLNDGVADPALARRVGYTKPAWLVPASDGRSICVLTTASLSCPLSTDVLEHGLAPSVSWTAQGPVRVSGIASDAVNSVDVILADGTVQAVEVANSLLDYSADRAPREVRWTGPDGPHTFAVPEITGR
jgi:hypothetical protein